MNFTNLLTFVPRAIRRLLLEAADLIDRHLAVTARTIGWALFFNFALLFVGELIAWVGFRIDTLHATWMIGLGQSIVSFAGFAAAVCWIAAFTILFAVGEGTTYGSQLIQAVVRDVTRPLPGPTVELPAVSAEQMDRVLRSVAAAFGWIVGFAALSNLFPMYVSIRAFFGIAIGATVIAFVSYGYNLIGPWAQRVLLGIGVATLVFNLLSTMFSGQFMVVGTKHLYWQKEAIMSANAAERIEASRLSRKSWVIDQLAWYEERRQAQGQLTADQAKRVAELQQYWRALESEGIAIAPGAPVQPSSGAGSGTSSAKTSLPALPGYVNVPVPNLDSDSFSLDKVEGSVPEYSTKRTMTILVGVILALIIGASIAPAAKK